MSVRRHLFAPTVLLSALAGTLKLNGLRAVHDALGLSPGDPGVQLLNASLQFVEFGVAVGLPFAIGYWVGGRSDLREDHVALAAVTVVAALVGYTASVGVTLATAGPDHLGIPGVFVVTYLVTSALTLAVAVLAGAGVGYVRAVRDGTHAEIA
jgi:hypothetical protein